MCADDFFFFLQIGPKGKKVCSKPRFHGRCKTQCFKTQFSVTSRRWILIHFLYMMNDKTFVAISSRLTYFFR